MGGFKCHDDTIVFMERAGKSPIQIMVSPDTLREIDERIASKQFASRSDFGLKAIERFLSKLEYDGLIEVEVNRIINSQKTDLRVREIVRDSLAEAMNHIGSQQSQQSQQSR